MSPQLPMPPGDPDALDAAAERFSRLYTSVVEPANDLNGTVEELLRDHWKEGQGRAAAQSAVRYVAAGGWRAAIDVELLGHQITAWSRVLRSAQDRVREHQRQVDALFDPTLRHTVSPGELQQEYSTRRAACLAIVAETQAAAAQQLAAVRQEADQLGKLSWARDPDTIQRPGMDWFTYQWGDSVGDRFYPPPQPDPAARDAEGAAAMRDDNGWTG